MLEELGHLVSRALCALVALGGAIGAYVLFHKLFIKGSAVERQHARWRVQFKLAPQETVTGLYSGTSFGRVAIAIEPNDGIDRALAFVDAYSGGGYYRFFTGAAPGSAWLMTFPEAFPGAPYPSREAPTRMSPAGETRTFELVHWDDAYGRALSFWLEPRGIHAVRALLAGAPAHAYEQAASVAIDSKVSPSPRVAWAKASQLNDASGGALAGSVLRRLSIGLFQAARASALSFALVGS